MTADVLIIGAGPAGLAAAKSAREGGASVLVLDDNPTPGGQIWRGGNTGQYDTPVVCGVTVIAADAAARTVLVEGREYRYGRLVIATGSREIFLPFPGWTLPGVTGAGGLQALVKSGLPVAGKRIVVAGSGPLLLAVADYLHEHGATIRLVAEQATSKALASFALHLPPDKLFQGIKLRLRLPYRTGSWVERVDGNGRVERVHVRNGSRTMTEECDYAAVSYGLEPNTELAALLGCRVDAEGIAVDQMQQSTVEGIYCAGECTGIGGVDLSLIEGEIAGYAATGNTARSRSLFGARERQRRFAAALARSFALRDELRQLAQPDTIVCRCEDVTLGQLQRYPSLRAAKLHTRCGMGPCQGRICGTSAKYLFGWSSTSVRPPVFPASVAALANSQEAQVDR